MVPLIYKIAENAINGLDRPKYLSRVKKDETNKTENPKNEKIKKSRSKESQ